MDGDLNMQQHFDKQQELVEIFEKKKAEIDKTGLAQWGYSGDF